MLSILYICGRYRVYGVQFPAPHTHFTLPPARTHDSYFITDLAIYMYIYDSGKCGPAHAWLDIMRPRALLACTERCVGRDKSRHLGCLYDARTESGIRCFIMLLLYLSSTILLFMKLINNTINGLVPTLKICSKVITLQTYVPLTQKLC